MPDTEERASVMQLCVCKLTSTRDTRWCARARIEGVGSVANYGSFFLFLGMGDTSRERESEGVKEWRHGVTVICICLRRTATMTFIWFYTRWLHVFPDCCHGSAKCISAAPFYSINSQMMTPKSFLFSRTECDFGQMCGLAGWLARRFT